MLIYSGDLFVSLHSSSNMEQQQQAFQLTHLRTSCFPYITGLDFV